MKTITLLKMTLAALLLPGAATNAQCADAGNVYLFSYNGKSYEIIKENKTWAEAASCAVSRGGYLAEINSAEEQQAIFGALSDAGINNNDTQAPDGFGAYVWLGGNDMSIEGLWALNGDNDDQALFFWQGAANGAPMSNRYNNWGNEPDNWGADPGQDALAMSIAGFPNGAPGEWNDLSQNNSLFFVVEHNTLGTVKNEASAKISLYPNPTDGTVSINNHEAVTKVIIYNTAGQQLRALGETDLASGKIDISDFPAGIYMLNLIFEDNTTHYQKLIRK